MSFDGNRSRFTFSPGGKIAAGQRRLKGLLLGMSLLMLVVAVAALVGGQSVAGFLALGAGLMSWVAWRMSGELTPLWLELEDEVVALQTRTQRMEIPRVGATARILTLDELEHLERLASAAGIVAPIGGFDSHILGEFNLYASDLRHGILIDGKESRWVVTPDDPDAFLAAFQSAIGS